MKEFIDTDKMPIPPAEAGFGVWENVPVPDDGDPRKAAILGAGIEAVAERTTWLRHHVVTAKPYAVTIPTLTNNGATVGASNDFVVKNMFHFTEAVPTGAGGGESPAVWTTPSIPYVIEGAYVRLTENATASGGVPGLMRLDLLLGANVLVSGGLSSFSGGLLIINGTTSNKSVVGLALADRGPLLDGTIAGNGLDSLGGVSAEGKLTAHTGAVASVLFGQDIKVRLVHSSGSTITFYMPMEVVIYGRLL